MVASSPGRFGRPVRLGSATDQGCRVEPQPLENALPRHAAFAIGHINQPADAAQQTVLILIEHTVGVGDFPQHLDQFDPLRKRQPLVDDSGEMEELGRAAGLTLAGDEQGPCILARQFEAPFEQPRDHGAFPFVEMVVAVRHLDEQCSESQLQLVLRLCPAARGRTRQPPQDAVNHGPVPSMPHRARATPHSVWSCRAPAPNPIADAARRPRKCNRRTGRCGCA